MSACNVSLTLPISGWRTARLLSEDALCNYLSTSFFGLSSPPRTHTIRSGGPTRHHESSLPCEGSRRGACYLRMDYAVRSLPQRSLNHSFWGDFLDSLLAG